MRRLALVFAVMILPAIGRAETTQVAIMDIVEQHILPRMKALAEKTQAFAEVAAVDCSPTSPQLKSAYNAAFDAWVSASHLRYGPMETDDRAFALAFWPDSRGATPRALAKLIADQDPVATSVEEYREVSIAARGFYAMEYLLYDDALLAAGDASYHCVLVQTVSADIAATSKNILLDWFLDYSALVMNPAPDTIYPGRPAVLQEPFKALTTGLQFTSEYRLGRPLGTFDRPRPARAEARRSGRSSLHVMLSLASLRDLAAHLTRENPDLAATLNISFHRAMQRLAELEDPVFASVSAPQTRLRVEVVQQDIDAIREIVRDELGPELGVAAGFNALDGD